MNHMQTTFALHRYHKYTIEDLYSMMPWERQVVVHQVMDAMEKEKQAQSGTTNMFDEEM